MIAARPLLPFTLLLLAFASRAAPGEPHGPAYALCMDDSGGTTVTMLDCISQELQRQDRRLNAAYRALATQLPPARMQQLKLTQRLWLQYRDANCGFHADPDGGTLATISANECVLDETAERAEELESFAAVE